MIKIIILICFFEIAPSATFAQFRDSLSHSDSTQMASLGDSILRFNGTDSTLHAGDIGLQFLAGEVAFNATSFSLFGNSFYSGQNQVPFLSGLGLVLSAVTVPLAIHFTNGLLHLETGSLGWSMLGAFLAIYPVSALIFQSTFIHSPQTYAARYFSVSLPMITLAGLFYDLSMSDSE